MNRVSGLIPVVTLWVVLVSIACGENTPSPLPTSLDTPQPTALATTPPTSASEQPVVSIVPTPMANPKAESRLDPPATPTLPTHTPTSTPLPYTVIDSNGNDVVFEKPPKRIVALDSAAVEMLFAIGEGHRVVGTHSFVSYPPEVTNIPKMGDAFNIDIELTVDLEPDLVFVFFDRFQLDLERAGLKVLYVKTLSDDFTKIGKMIRMWGRITARSTAAEDVAADFEACVERIKNTLRPYERGPTVFQDVGEFWTPGTDTLVSEVFELLKLENIAKDVSGYAQLSPEIIVERNPQIIFTGNRETFMGNVAFKNVSAVINDRVFELQPDLLSIAGPRFVHGIEEIARIVYPELFEQVKQNS